MNSTFWNLSHTVEIVFYTFDTFYTVCEEHENVISIMKIIWTHMIFSYIQRRKYKCNQHVNDQCTIHKSIHAINAISICILMSL